MATFDDLNDKSARKQSICPVCGEKMEQGEERGRIQITLTGLTYERAGGANNYSAEKPKATHKQRTRSIAATSRILCESCAVETYLKIEAVLPAALKRSDTKG